MATVKQDARRLLDGLPEEASLEDIQVERRLARWLDE